MKNYNHNDQKIDKKAILNSISEFIVSLDDKLRILWANEFVLNSLGLDLESIVGKYCYEIFYETTQKCDDCPCTLASETKRVQMREFTTPDGRIWFIKAYPLFSDKGKLVSITELRSDITTQKIIEESLKETKELFQFLAENTNDIIYRFDISKSRSFGYINPRVFDLTGYNANDFYQNPMLLSEITHHEDKQKIEKCFFGEGFCEGLFSHRVFKKDGKIVWIEHHIAPFYNEDGTLISLEGVARDVSERKRGEEKKRLIIGILKILNSPKDKINEIGEILSIIKDFTGFEAVGIRLHENDDYPYYETKGFSKEFVEAERFLCSKDQNGEVIKDTNGNPVLECMCGTVIQGKTDPLKPFFTKRGSFWTNSTTSLLETTSEDDGQVRTRNRCNGEGYESVALIPLKSSDEIIGLLQLNDFKKNMFTLDDIRFFEEIGESIGIAFNLIRSNEEREKLYDECNNALKEVKKLSGLLPICSNCKKVRDDEGYWEQIEEYISKHSEADFSHGYCPDCANKERKDLQSMLKK